MRTTAPRSELVAAAMLCLALVGCAQTQDARRLAPLVQANKCSLRFFRYTLAEVVCSLRLTHSDL